ncbi:MAG TPA: glycosyltransferase [Microbacterium sp.]|uniref:glycosyltransferase n=1 Tax=Microbacterium sp. TaxID=51671 RepID=UPI002BCEF23A|nr:glycosyltransferase [Microbacterium sp.]HWI31139.1 glycosyltransferase [Microbacterium sp.]
MRVALLAESFLPHMNGVTNSVLHVLRHLERRGHETLLIAPGSGDVDPGVPAGRTELLRSMPLPSYPDVRVVIARTARLTRMVQDFAPDVLHLASPFVLGWQGVAVADALRIPAVSIYQTDVIAYSEKYGVPGAAPLVASHIRRLHRRSTLTLAPSSAAAAQLDALGVDRVRLWGRGVDSIRFDPERRSEDWRASIAPGEILVGYAGRLAAEKQVDDLRVLAGVPGVRLVVIGDGPARERLQGVLPDAVFTGFLDGIQLAEALAGLDVFVHPGESETFCQGVQEALASGVPVVATGRGGPLDLVRNSINGWLYPPGDLGALRAAVEDLVGDAAKRRAFGIAARESVAGRTWHALGDQLIGHYADAIPLRRVDDRRFSKVGERPALPAIGPKRAMPRRFVALGDSLTEGLCDGSRMPDGAYRGWADRLAELLAHANPSGRPLRYANLAVRSRRVVDVVTDQIPRALELRADLVSVLIGANDLVRFGADPEAIAARLAEGIRTLRAAGVEVLLVTPFLPRRRAARVLARRFALFSAALRALARETGCLLLDLEAVPEISDPSLWAADLVHINSGGHRYVAYEAAALLGVPHAGALGRLEGALHAEEADEVEPPISRARWVTHHAVPWALRRLRGRTAGDGLLPKHDDLVTIGGTTPVRAKG